MRSTRFSKPDQRHRRIRYLCGEIVFNFGGNLNNPNEMTKFRYIKNLCPGLKVPTAYTLAEIAKYEAENNRASPPLRVVEDKDIASVDVE